MRYTTEVTIDLPRARVIELFDNPDNMAKWQKGFKSMETIEGEAGTAGAKSRLLYDENGREVEMIETIIRSDLPDEISFVFEAKHVRNQNENRFHETGDGTTRWVQDNEFRSTGLMALMAIFIRGAFPKQTLKDMNRFKAFAEQA